MKSGWHLIAGTTYSTALLEPLKAWEEVVVRGRLDTRRGISVDLAWAEYLMVWTIR